MKSNFIVGLYICVFPCLRQGSDTLYSLSWPASFCVDQSYLRCTAILSLLLSAKIAGNHFLIWKSDAIEQLYAVIYLP